MEIRTEIRVEIRTDDGSMEWNKDQARNKRKNYGGIRPESDHIKELISKESQISEIRALSLGYRTIEEAPKLMNTNFDEYCSSPLLPVLKLVRKALFRRF